MTPLVILEAKHVIVYMSYQLVIGESLLSYSGLTNLLEGYTPLGSILKSDQNYKSPLSPL